MINSMLNLSLFNVFAMSQPFTFLSIMILPSESTHSRGVRLNGGVSGATIVENFNPRTHEECDRNILLVIA